MPTRKAKKPAGPPRGFATVSIQKKVAPVEETPAEPETQPPSVTADQTEPPTPETGLEPAAEEEEQVGEDELELQRLAELLKPGCDRESTRMLKVLEYDQRISKSYPSFAWRESTLKEDILRLALEEDDRLAIVPVPFEQEHKLLSRMITFFTVLERIGVERDRIIACYRSVRCLEWEDILDWLALHSSDAELEFCGARLTEQQPHIFVDAAQKPLSSPERNPQSRADSSSSTSTLASSSTVASTPPSLALEEPDLTPTARYRSIEEEEHPVVAKTQPIVFDESLEEDPVGAFVSAKLELLALGRRTEVTPQSQSRIEALEARMKDASGRYRFDEKEAEAAFRAGKAKADTEALRERLSQPVETKVKKARTTALLTAAESKEGDQTMFGNLLEESAVEEETVNGKPIKLLDMAVPKTWSATPPKGLLEETIRRIDRFATVNFRVISQSRAVRAAVLIRWDSGRADEFGMSDVACRDQTQAFNYVATLALFPIATSPVHRQLPANFRDLWDRLSAKRQADQARLFRQHISLMQELASLRLGNVVEEKKFAPKSLATSREEMPSSFKAAEETEPSFQLHQAFTARQESIAYREMLAYRSALPIASYRHDIVEAVAQHQVVILCGETGCGKSTQLPAFILEQWLSQGRQANILVTEPRRISAISLAQRVSKELGDPIGSCGGRGALVGYSVRLEARTSPTTRLIYATTGIALRMLEGDTALQEFTHLIIDEVHERTIDSDFLMITLKELLQRRPDLRLVLMSATVDSAKLSDYWNGCPVFNIPGRTFPISSYFLEDVVELCGYRLDMESDSPYVRRSRPGQKPRHLGLDDDTIADSDEDEPSAASELGKRYSKQTRATLEAIDERQINYELLMLLIEAICFRSTEFLTYSKSILIFMPSLESIRRLTDLLEGHEILGGPDFRLFPLHSTISNENQALVFDTMPHGVRKIVIATNIAETGITIPDITCVIDSGRHREMLFDEKRQISRLVETYIARSNAAQRRGRAGRVQEGIAFAMFTRHKHDTQFADHPQPEMLRLSLQDLAMRIKILEFRGTIADVLLRALDPPALNNIERAIAALVEVKALTPAEEITVLGRYLAKLPVDVHLGKLLLLGCLFRCLDAALTIVATLNAKSPWVTPFGREAEADAAKRSFKVENSDFLTLHRAFSAWREACMSGMHLQFTRKNFLGHQTLCQIEELRTQFFNLLCDEGFVDPGIIYPPATSKARIRFLQIHEALDSSGSDPRVIMACVGCAVFPKVLVVNDSGSGWKTMMNSAPAAVHPTSVNFNFGRRPEFGPGCKYIAYFNIIQSKKLYVWENGPVEEQAVIAICGGEAEIKIAAHTVSIDRNRVRAQVDARSALALKRLRAKFNECLAARLKGKEWTPAQAEWWSLICRAISMPDKDRKAREEKQRQKDMKSTASMSIKMIKNT